MQMRVFLPILFLISFGMSAVAAPQCRSGELRSAGGYVEMCANSGDWKALNADPSEPGSVMAARRMVPSLFGNLWTVVGQGVEKDGVLAIDAKVMNRACVVNMRRSSKHPDGWFAERVDCKAA